MSVLTTTPINGLLLSSHPSETGVWQPDLKWGFLIHHTVLPAIRKFLKSFGIQYLWDQSSYELQIGDKLFDMVLIYLTRKSDELANIMYLLVEISQFTFYWERRCALFSTPSQLHILKEFISMNNLQKFIMSEKEEPGFNSKDECIVVITFKMTRVNYYELIEKYRRFRNSKPFNENSHVVHYYVTFVFPWLQPTRLRHFDIPFKNERVFHELQTYLTCMRELSYDREPYLDFFELCSLKLAFCDDRNVTRDSAELEFEIINLIERSLKRMDHTKTYIKNAEFNLERYAIDRNCAPSLLTIAAYYFQYKLQNYFQSIRLPNLIPEFNIQTKFQLFPIPIQLKPPNLSLSLHVPQTIKLVEEKNILNTLNEMPNARFLVHGLDYTEMNHKLFCEIISCQNVRSIVLDTNYKWSNQNACLYRGDAKNLMMNISLLGDNRYKFIEGFLVSFAKVSRSQNVRLLINTTLDDCEILKDLKIMEIQFTEIKLTSKMLIELHNCNFKQTRLTFIKCTMENNVKTWELLNELNAAASVIVEEKTWEYIFEYIFGHLSKLRLNEFLFKIQLVIENNTMWAINLTKLKFMLNESGTKLEIVNAFSGEILDLYGLMNPEVALNDDKNLYEFYN